jgi:hypothetical protein
MTGRYRHTSPPMNVCLLGSEQARGFSLRVDARSQSGDRNAVSTSAARAQHRAFRQCFCKGGGETEAA